MKELTAKQKSLLDYIANYQKEYKVMPTFVEMANAMGLKISALQTRLDALKRKKVLERKNIYIIK